MLSKHTAPCRRGSNEDPVTVVLVITSEGFNGHLAHACAVADLSRLCATERDLEQWLGCRATSTRRTRRSTAWALAA